MSAQRTFVDGSTPYVLLGHGGFADASGWAGVIAELLHTGIDSRTPCAGQHPRTDHHQCRACRAGSI